MNSKRVADFAGRVAALSTALAVLILPACRGAQIRVDPLADRPSHLRVLAIHDFHGALRSSAYAWSNGRPVGGAPAVKATFDALEEACACPAVRLDGGDQMQGSLESNLMAGASTVAAFNHLGLHAAAVGNHDLDWGVETLMARQRQARYPWLAANVFQLSDGKRPAWARPFALVRRRGVTIGVVGYATVSTPRTLRPDVTRPYRFVPGYAPIRDALEAVWRERPDFVIVVAHAGGDCGVNGCAGEMVDLASELPPGRVHLIVGGHTHAPGEGVVNAIPIVRAGANGRAVGIVDLYRDATGARTFKMTTHTVFADAVPADEGMADLLAPYFLAADARGREPVTVLAEPLTAAPTGDRRLGGLIAEAARQVAKADIGLHNPGGVRADLPRGAISYSDLHRVMPFDNTVVRLSLTGLQLRRLIDQAGPRYYFANLLIDGQVGRASDGGRVALRLGDATPIRDEGEYTLATSDFLADGGDGFDMLSTLPRETASPSLLETLVDYFRRLPRSVALSPEVGEAVKRAR